MFWRLSVAALFALAALPLARPAGAAKTKIVFIAGPPSHGPGDHEYHAGLLLMAGCLKSIKEIETVVIPDGWPADDRVLEGAKSIVLFMDGGGAHPLVKNPGRFMALDKLMKKGVGIVCIHYTLEVPQGPGAEYMQDWVGGFYENGYSTNPMNELDLTITPKHPITNGVKPFKLVEEWYYRIRFRNGDSRVTPLLTAMLPKDKPQREPLAWATVRADGGRGFGFTGGHFHRNWGVEDYRKIVLNAIVWSARLKVPGGGVQSTVTPEQLKENLDTK